MNGGVAILIAIIICYSIGQGLSNIGNGIGTGLEEIAKAIKENKKN